MDRKLISAFLALILCLSLALSVSAAERPFVVDELGYLTEEEVAELNSLAAQIYQERGVAIFYIYTLEEDLKNFDISPYVGDISDHFVVVESQTGWRSVLGGRAADALDNDAILALREVYDLTDTYVAGVRDFLYAAAERFPRSEPAAPVVSDTEVIMAEALVYDEADLLSDSEEMALTSRLDAIGHTYEAQIVIATISSMNGGNVDTYVDYVYDTMGFGYGENRDGVLLLVCMDPREYRILSNGYAAAAIDPGIISDIGDAIVSDLSDGDYADAFDIFADKCDYYLNGYLNGFPFDFGGKLTVALVVGLVAGLITAFVLKGQLTTVYKQDKANDYIKDNSMQVTTHSDLFLYRNVTRTRRQSSSSSSGSSGSSRSKGGDSF